MLRKEVVMHDHPAAALFPTMGADEFVTIHNAMTSNPKPKNDSTPASTAAKGRKKTRAKLVRVRRLPARKADPNAKNTYARYGVARPSRAKPGAIWGRPPTVPYDGELGIEICRLIATGANLSEAIRILCGPDTKLTRNIVLGWRLEPASKIETIAWARGTSRPLSQIKRSRLRGSSAGVCVPFVSITGLSSLRKVPANAGASMPTE